MKSIHHHCFRNAAVTVLLLICILAVPQAFADKVFPTVNTDQLKAMIDQKHDLTRIDARTPPEYKEGQIPTAINIPSETFASGSGVLPKEKRIIVYCNTGSRSYLAYKKR